MVLQILFWCSLLLLFHTYIGYSVLLALLSKGKKDNQVIYSPTEALPSISIVISVYNEALVIEKRVRNIYTTTYPSGNFEVIIGSDGSDDDTNLILSNLQKEFPTLKVAAFPNRQGKPNVINHLVPICKNDFLVFTDAKVEFTPDTLYQLVKNFKNNEIACVGGNIINRNIVKSGIPLPEKTYMSLEMLNKYYEGKIWGTTMGVYGACYAIPREYFTPFPQYFSVEDFFISMHILERNKKCILDIGAKCYENVPNKLSEEFRRKVRISAGNFQNLQQYKKLALPFSSLGLCFLSHKVIRWFGPILLIILFISNLLLINTHSFYLYSLYIQLFFLLIPLIDFFLHIIRRDILILRFISHFYSMNLALLIGFIKYLKGVKTNVWEPTKR